MILPQHPVLRAVHNMVINGPLVGGSATNKGQKNHAQNQSRWFVIEEYGTTFITSLYHTQPGQKEIPV